MISLPLAIVALLTGHSSLKTIRKAGARITGRWMAIGGLILGYAALATALFAIILPSSMQAPRIEQERTATDVLWYMSSAADAFHKKFPERGYPRDLAELEEVSSNMRDPLSSRIQQGKARGYSFMYAPRVANGGTGVSGYSATADPPSGSGLSHFYLGEDGVIRVERKRAAGPNSPKWR